MGLFGKVFGDKSSNEMKQRLALCKALCVELEESGCDMGLIRQRIVCAERRGDWDEVDVVMNELLDQKDGHDVGVWLAACRNEQGQPGFRVGINKVQLLCSKNAPVRLLEQLPKSLIDECMHLMVSEEFMQRQEELREDYKKTCTRLIYLAWLFANDLASWTGEVCVVDKGVWLDEAEYEGGVYQEFNDYCVDDCVARLKAGRV